MTNLRRKALIIGGGALIGLIVCAVAAFLIFKGRHFTLYIEREQIQAAIAQRLPYRKPFLIIFELRVDTLDVKLRDGSDRVGAHCHVELDAQLNGQSKRLGGTFDADTRLRYDPQDACFYLIDPVILSVDVQGVPQRYEAALAAAATQVMQHVVDRQPVYRITDASLRLRLARAVIQEVRVVNGRVMVTLGY